MVLKLNDIYNKNISDIIINDVVDTELNINNVIYNFVKFLHSPNYKKTNVEHNNLINKTFIELIQSKITESNDFVQIQFSLIQLLYIYVLTYYGFFINNNQSVRILGKRIYQDDDNDNDNVNDNDSDNNTIEPIDVIEPNIVDEEFNIEQFANQLVQQLNEQVNEPLNESVDQSVDYQFNESLNEQLNESSNELVTEHVNELIIEPVNEPVNELVDELIIEPVNEEFNIDIMSDSGESFISDVLSSDDNNAENNYSNIEKENIINDISFVKLFDIVLWNEKLLEIFLMLIIVIDDVTLFDYVYQYTKKNNYSIDLNNIIKFIKTNNFPEYHDVKFSIFGIRKFLNILTYLMNLHNSNDKKLIFVKDIFSDFNPTNLVHYMCDSIQIDIRMEFYISFECDNRMSHDIYLIYKYFDDLNLLDDELKTLIFKYIVGNKTKLSKNKYLEIIKEFNITQNQYFLTAIENNNNKFIDMFIDINKLPQDILQQGAILLAQKNHNFRQIIDKVCSKKNINKLNESFDYIIFNIVKYDNCYFLKKILPHCLSKNVISEINFYQLFRYLNRYNFRILGRQLLKHQIKFNFDEKQLLHWAINSPNLLINLIKYKQVDDEMINILFNKIIHFNNNVMNSRNCNKVLCQILKKINPIFNIDMCNLLYKNKLYDVLCIYLLKTSTQHNYSYGNLLNLSYKKIIYAKGFDRLIFKLKLTSEQANDIIKNIYKNKSRWMARTIHGYCKNVFKLDVKPLN